MKQADCDAEYDAAQDQSDAVKLLLRAQYVI